VGLKDERSRIKTKGKGCEDGRGISQMGEIASGGKE
jgi:hypothetical protein